ncbi:MAG TPA: FadR family transcriptional regulator [Candidatus Salinicoccus stercoripullorum]|uniref:FadR family transcriptional regulator n=1 Tax=Candidatus Salinicoccus stercoripullorum TaxID=2838756 RepID=A0A9D1TZN3_9STAP|nr:FadR family transcriptional regulator [Candidatus Salinicoccus stercoripullorum]
MEPISNTERKSLKQTVIQEIKSYIIEHGLSEGDKLPTERKFTEMYGVSRSVVREALSYLENTGVISIRQGQGATLSRSNIDKLLSNFFFLWKINGGDFEEVLSLRMIFESSAIDEIIRNDGEQFTALEAILEGYDAVDSAAMFREIDREFHERLLQATGNDLFIQMTSIITNYFFEIAPSIDLNREEIGKMLKEHKEIIEKIIDKDAEGAKKILAGHLGNVRKD